MQMLTTMQCLTIYMNLLGFGRLCLANSEFKLHSLDYLNGLKQVNKSHWLLNGKVGKSRTILNTIEDYSKSPRQMLVENLGSLIRPFIGKHFLISITSFGSAVSSNILEPYILRQFVPKLWLEKRAIGGRLVWVPENRIKLNTLRAVPDLNFSCQVSKFYFKYNHSFEDQCVTLNQSLFSRAVRPWHGELHITIFMPEYFVQDIRFKTYDVMSKNSGIYNIHIQMHRPVNTKNFDRLKTNDILFIALVEQASRWTQSVLIKKLIIYSKCLEEHVPLCKVEVCIRNWDKYALLKNQYLLQHRIFGTQSPIDRYWHYQEIFFTFLSCMDHVQFSRHLVLSKKNGQS